MKIIERKTVTGKTEYGVQYNDGHISWQESLPAARYAYMKAALPKAKRIKTKR